MIKVERHPLGSPNPAGLGFLWKDRDSPGLKAPEEGPLEASKRHSSESQGEWEPANGSNLNFQPPESSHCLSHPVGSISS